MHSLHLDQNQFFSGWGRLIGTNLLSHNPELQASSKGSVLGNCSLPSPWISFTPASWIDPVLQLVNEVTKTANIRSSQNDQVYANICKNYMHTPISLSTSTFMFVSISTSNHHLQKET